MSMSTHKSLSAPLLAALLVLLGGAAAGVALAQDAGPSASQSDTGANPIDTSVTTQPPSHSKRGAKAHGVKKFSVARSSGNSGIRHRDLLHAGKPGVVRNSIGQPVAATITDIKATQTQHASEPPNAHDVGKTTVSPGTNPVGKSATPDVPTVPHSQGFVPLHTTVVTPKEPRINTAMNRSIISGRDMIRPGSGAGTIGGPAKNASGTISGTRSRLGSP
jgi:hypothetical protein